LQSPGYTPVDGGVRVVLFFVFVLCIVPSVAYVSALSILVTKVQSRIDNAETYATLGTIHRTKTKKSTTRTPPYTGVNPGDCKW
jgi:hypothetical protein